MLPSSDTSGNDPVRSLYTIPLVLSANAPKQNTLAIVASLSSYLSGLVVELFPHAHQSSVDLVAYHTPVLGMRAFRGRLV